MTEKEYNEIQQRLKNKLTNIIFAYDTTTLGTGWKIQEAAKQAINSAMSIVKSVYNKRELVKQGAKKEMLENA